MEPTIPPDMSTEETATKPLMAGKWVFAAVCMLTFSTLMYELLLTRIFSLLTYYHFAFLAVSLGMLGATAGALAVYLAPNRFPLHKTNIRMGQASFAMSLTMVVSVLLMVSRPFALSQPYYALGETSDRTNVVNALMVFFSVMLPFFCSGVAVTLALTRFPRQIGRIYAIDLVGAAAGCVAIIIVLRFLDGPSSVFFVATLGLISALWFFKAGHHPALTRATYVLLALMAGTTLWQGFTAGNKDLPRVEMKYVKGFLAAEGEYEDWNSYSHIKVIDDVTTRPMGWGLSQRYRGPGVDQKILQIDGGATTHMTKFDGNTSSVEFLKWDIINAANELRSNADVFVIGSGGGRDLLSALVYDQKSVTGVEINESTVDAIKGPYYEYTGKIADHPKVTVANDEARSYLSRTPGKFDIIQISLIDTWAASSAGAYVLTENTLYTVEAWEGFLDKLTSGGIVTCSRWFNKQGPTEVYRNVALAARALKNHGVKVPRKNIIGLRTTDRRPEAAGVYAATLLVSNQAFSPEDIRKVEEFCERLGFEIFLSPVHAESKTFIDLARNKAHRLEKTMAVRLQAPTDDSPFFFNFIKFRDIFNEEAWNSEFFNFNLAAVRVLAYILLLVLATTFFCVVLPLLIVGTHGTGKTFYPMLIYFACIGLGFMLVEISQLQRLAVFLGHPIYSLAVVLFSILLSSGFGSYLTHFVTSTRGRIMCYAGLLITLVAFGLATPPLVDAFRGSTTVVRILVAGLMLVPMGIFMGMGFPLGMSLAQARTPNVTAWLWGINGVTSVLGSVLAITISLFRGITSSFWVGISCYVLAALIYVLVSLSRKRSGSA